MSIKLHLFFHLVLFNVIFSLTFLFLQEVNGSLQDGGFVHLAGVTLTLQHRTQLFNENIELVSSLLL